MKGAARYAHILGVFLVLLWGAVLLYFYGSGRINVYLTGENTFRGHVLVAGVVLVIVGLFNFLTRNEDCDCGHDHGHGHDHDHEGEEGNHEGKACCGGHDHDHEHHHHDDHAGCGHDHDHGHTHEGHEEHDHDHHAFFGGATFGSCIGAALVLAIPLTVAAVMSPDQFSAQAIINKGLYSQDYAAAGADGGKGLRAVSQDTPPGDPGIDNEVDGSAALPELGEFTLEDLEAQVDRSEAGNFLLEVPELFYTASDREVQAVLEGQPVETIAQVMPEKLNNDGGRRVRIFRLFIECCAADARPLSIPVEFPEQAPEFRELGWVKVTGRMTYKLEAGATVPILLAEDMEEVEAPEERMMY